MEELNEFYKTYGESLATRLKAIAHGRAGQTFVFVEDMGDPAEVLTFVVSGKSPEGASVLIWENFEEDLDSGGRDNYHSVIVGSLAVIRKGKNRDEISQAYASGRSIVLAALALMLQDGQDGLLSDAAIQVEVRRMPATKIKALATSWYGYMVEFTWIAPLDLTLQAQDLL